MQESQKTLVLFLDQFEEITTKQELADLFNTVRRMANAVDSAQEQVVLGFSWKTDGTIPIDHPAYHVWHSIADRRREFELTLFSSAEISQLLGTLGKELNQPIDSTIRRLLGEHCQGYPWLLKKLCIHVFQVLQQRPAQQRELLERALDVESLFQKDLTDLSTQQLACLEEVARTSPADNYRIENLFGNPTVTSLVQRRLLVRNAGKLILYWDIFRDYVLTKQVPSIPSRYIPVSMPGPCSEVLESLHPSTSTTLQALVSRANRQLGTLDNIARDLVMSGAVIYDRRNAKLRLIHAAPEQSLAAMGRFFSSHQILRRAVEQFGKGFADVPFDAFEKLVRETYAADRFTDKTIRVSTRRLLKWFEVFGIVTGESDDKFFHQTTTPVLTAFSELKVFRERTKEVIFRGEAPPHRVIEVLNKIKQPGYSVEPGDRNPMYVLRSLRIVPSTVSPVLVDRPGNADIRIWLASRVLGQQSLKNARAILRANPSANDVEVGSALEAVLGKNLSEPTKKRYGGGLKNWVHWLDDLTQPRRPEA